MDNFVRVYGNELYVRSIIYDLCKASEDKEKTEISFAENILTASFISDSGPQAVQLSLDEIISKIREESIDDKQIRDYIISLVRDKLVGNICDRGVKKMGKDIQKKVEIYNTVTNVLDFIFPDKVTK